MGSLLQLLLLQGGKSSVLENPRWNSSLPSCLLLLCPVQLILVMMTMDILSINSMMVLIVMTRRTNSAIRSQKNKNMKNVMLIILRSVSMLQRPTAMKNKSLVTTILVLLDMTPGLLMNTMLITTTRGQLMLENMDTTVVLSVKTRRSRSATSIPMRTLARSPRQLARRLLTPFTLRSVRKLSTLFVRKLTSSIITVSMLLDMNQMLLLDLLAFMKNTRERAMVMDMEDMGVIRFLL